MLQIIEEVDNRFLPDPPARLDEIASQVQSTLLNTIPPELECHATQSPLQGHSVDETPGPGLAVQGGVGVGMEEEYVHEPEWGPEREDVLGEEREGDMD